MRTIGVQDHLSAGRSKIVSIPRLGLEEAQRFYNFQGTCHVVVEEGMSQNCSATS